LVGNGKVEALRGRQVTGSSSRMLEVVPGSEFEIPADLVLVAIGFLHPDHEGPVKQLELELDKRGNVRAPAFHTSREGVWVAGDARVGQSLIVTAIAEGRRCARAVDRRLRSGETS
jgi:glutamate synthase (NADPH/NADH) small chain